MAWENVSFSEIVGVLGNTQVELDGLDGCHQNSGKSNILPQGGTVCGTADAQNPPLDPQLQLLIERWPTLSQQQQIMLLVGWWGI
jgi:hypothetical protein